MFQDSHVALKALSQYFRLYNDFHEHEHVNVDVNVTLSNKKQLSLKVLSPFFVGSLYFDVGYFDSLVIYYMKLLIILIIIYKALQPQSQFSSESGIVRRGCPSCAGSF